MTTVGNAKRKIRTIMMRSRSHLRGQNKTMFNIHGSMFLNSVVGDIIFDCPVRFQIAGELKRLAVLINFSLRRFTLCFFFMKYFIVEWMGSTDCTRRASMAMPSLIVKPLAANCERSSWLIIRIVSLENRPLNREKVE
jgi:hypothetical protein